MPCNKNGLCKKVMAKYKKPCLYKPSDSELYLCYNKGKRGLTGQRGETGATGQKGDNGATGPAGGTFGGIYGSFYYDVSQTAFNNLNENTIYNIQHNNTFEANGVSIDNTDTSKINISTPGIYKISYSCQLGIQTNPNNPGHAIIWIATNGTNLANSTSHVMLTTTSSTNKEGETFPYCEYIIKFTNPGYFQIRIQKDIKNIYLLGFPATTNYPATPSIITNVYRIG
jgi:hypothetical protein